MSGNDENWYIRWEIHRWLDNLWKNHEEREMYYERIAAELGIPKNECHISKLNKEQLDKTLELVKKWWKEKYDR